MLCTIITEVTFTVGKPPFCSRRQQRNTKRFPQCLLTYVSSKIECTAARRGYPLWLLYSTINLTKLVIVLSVMIRTFCIIHIPGWTTRMKIIHSCVSVFTGKFCPTENRKRGFSIVIIPLLPTSLMINRTANNGLTLSQLGGLQMQRQTGLATIVVLARVATFSRRDIDRW